MNALPTKAHRDVYHFIQLHIQLYSPDMSKYFEKYEAIPYFIRIFFFLPTIYNFYNTSLEYSLIINMVFSGNKD